MTSALAAALRELDRSRETLEQVLSQYPDYVSLRSIERSSDTGAPAGLVRRQVLIGRLESLPLFQALQAIVAAHGHVIEGGAVDAEGNQRAPLAVSTVAATKADAEARPAKPRPSFTPPNGPAQPLTAIRGITPALATMLQSLGIQRYEQIAEWRAEDVRDVAAELGLGRTISQRNWIEQAALLAMRAPDGWRPAMARANPSVVPAAPVELATLMPTPGKPVPQPVISAPETTATQSRALAHGDVLRVVAVAASAAVAGAVAMAPATARPARVSEPNSEDSPDFGVAAGPPVPPESFGMTSVAPPSLPSVQPVEQVAGTPAPETLPADSLHHIQGIDTAIARKLADVGADRFSIIAAWRAVDLAVIAKHLGLPARRISREGWIEQAAILATGGETKFSRRVARSDVDMQSPSPPLLPPTPPPAALVSTPPPFPANVANAPVPPMSIRIGERPMVEQGGSLGAGLSADSSEAGHDDEDHVDTDRDSPIDRVSRLDRSLARLIEDNGALSAVEEATVAFVTRAAPPSANVSAAAEKAASVAPVTSAGHDMVPSINDAPRVPPPIFRPPPRPANPPHVAPYAKRSDGAPSAVSASSQVAAAAEQAITEEAMVEIIRRDDPLTAHGGGAAAKVPLDRGPALTAGPRRGAGAQQDLQPAWIIDKKDEAAGVVRRFLKALKRNA